MEGLEVVLYLFTMSSPVVIFVGLVVRDIYREQNREYFIDGKFHKWKEFDEVAYWSVGGDNGSRGYGIYFHPQEKFFATWCGKKDGLWLSSSEDIRKLLIQKRKWKAYKKWFPNDEIKYKEGDWR